MSWPAHMSALVCVHVRVYGGSPLWFPGLEAWINSFIKQEVLRWGGGIDAGWTPDVQNWELASRQHEAGMNESAAWSLANLPRYIIGCWPPVGPFRPYIFPEGFVYRLADVPEAGQERPQGLLTVRVESKFSLQHVAT
jgi:hypothetical protein